MPKYFRKNYLNDVAWKMVNYQIRSAPKVDPEPIEGLCEGYDSAKFLVKNIISSLEEELFVARTHFKEAV